MTAIIPSVAPQVTVMLRLRIDLSRSGRSAPSSRRSRRGNPGAPGDRVLVDVGVDRGRRGVLDLGRAGEVGEALGEVDRAVLEREAGHLADHRFGEAGGLLRKRGNASGARGHPRMMHRPSSRCHGLRSQRDLSTLRRGDQSRPEVLRRVRPRARRRLPELWRAIRAGPEVLRRMRDVAAGGAGDAGARPTGPATAPGLAHVCERPSDVSSRCSSPISSASHRSASSTTPKRCAICCRATSISRVR